MPDWLIWFTRFENSKIVALLLFFVAFCGILLYVYTGKKRSQRLESYKYIPLQDDDLDPDAGDGEVKKDE
ncbi:Cbb3-type cytochrome oxidase component FixQ [Thiogranum longum]|uniref:Cbb3-type cytochrome oxidase component FixQ n=1 Tax=Thiogranum longum TaxID=1537524 RepID=A0A4V6NDA3_9GAMM|nr:CcoQ/FixQ family Cbb3-type cytochrome c oxidase assembly chaperone [Thiogranum longum]TCK17086.1 Cbb3-type cytochrome oxidase component FixQ [Thiogranum longum]